MQQAKSLTRRLETIVSAINNAISIMADEYPEDVKRIKDLHIQLRRAQKGIPIHDETELDLGLPALEVTPAEAQLVARLFRKLASKLHPDRGGNSDQFHIALTAYRMKDLPTLQYMHDTVYHVDTNDLLWKCSNIGFAEQRAHRIQTQISMLQQCDDFRIATLIMNNQIQEAKHLAKIVNIHRMQFLQTEIDAAILSNIRG